MNAVLAANLIVSRVLPLPYFEQSQELIRIRKQEGAELFSPVLWSYVVVSVLRKANSLQILSAEQLNAALGLIWDLGIQPVLPTPDLHRLLLEWAERLKRSKACDSAYLGAAESLHVEFWTADQRLAAAARQLGAEWVHVVGNS
ncbi:MAG: type II toxin-antitoxin system VapC family toxin [Anaerolineales bacterium]|nr:type II toxin-antitoxin system VapC family toxin [Anaerolineales bacterium]